MSEADWTRCTEQCEHRGPYRIYYRSGYAPLIKTEGCAQAGWALLDRTIVAYVMAPHEVRTKAS